MVSQSRQRIDVPPVITSQPNEGPDFCHILGYRPVNHGVDRLWVWCNSLLRNDVPKEPPKDDTLRLVKDDDLAQRYSVDISNRFQALAH